MWNCKILLCQILPFHLKDRSHFLGFFFGTLGLYIPLVPVHFTLQGPFGRPAGGYCGLPLVVVHDGNFQENSAPRIVLYGARGVVSCPVSKSLIHPPPPPPVSAQFVIAGSSCWGAPLHFCSDTTRKGHHRSNYSGVVKGCLMWGVHSGNDETPHPSRKRVTVLYLGSCRLHMYTRSLILAIGSSICSFFLIHVMRQTPHYPNDMTNGHDCVKVAEFF